MVKRLIREGVVIELPFTVWIDEEGIDRIPEVGMRNWEYLKRIMGAITEKIEKASKWIPFSERMPDDGQAILLSGNKIVGCDVWDDELKEWYRDYGEEATAWMPLPKCYEEEQK